MAIYNKTVWSTGDVITAAKLNNIENGIYNINATCNTINTKIRNLNNSITDINETLTATNQRIDEFIDAINNLDLDSVIARLNEAVLAIQANATNIATNADNISTNVTNISINSDRIDELEASKLSGTPITAEALHSIFSN